MASVGSATLMYVPQEKPTSLQPLIGKNTVPFFYLRLEYGFSQNAAYLLG